MLIIDVSALPLVLATLIALSPWEMRSDTLARACDAVDNLALILQCDTARNIEVYDLSLQVVTDGVRDPAMLALSSNVRQLVLSDRSTNTQDLGSLLVTSRAGGVITDSHLVPPRHICFGDHDYFLVHQTPGDVGLYISEPFIPHANSLERSLGLSRHLNGPHGKFNGIVVGTLWLNYFQRLFDGINLGSHTAITLIHTGGTLFMRCPYNEKLIGCNLAGAATFQKRLLVPEDSHVDITGIDSIERLFSFRHIGDHPLIATVGLATEDIYAEWWRHAQVISDIVPMLDVVFIVLSFLFTQQLRKRLEMEQQLHLLANTDSLTGLGTCRVLGFAFDMKQRRTNRYHTPMAILMIDIDDFRPYNDRYDHAADDTTLHTVARCTNDSTERPGDFAGRYGGEEFYAVLPNTDLSGAVHIAETIRAAALAADEPNAGNAYGKLTVNIGVAVHSGVAAEDSTLEDLVRLADGQLYEAKVAGRNVVLPRQERPGLAVV